MLSRRWFDRLSLLRSPPSEHLLSTVANKRPVGYCDQGQAIRVGTALKILSYVFRETRFFSILAYLGPIFLTVTIDRPNLI